MDIGRDNRCRDFSTVSCNHTHGLLILRQDFVYAAFRLDINTQGPSEGTHRLSNRSHTTLRDPPCTRSSINLTKSVVQKHIRGSRLIRIRKIPNRTFETQNAFQRVALKPAIKIITKGLGH